MVETWYIPCVRLKEALKRAGIPAEACLKRNYDRSLMGIGLKPDIVAFVGNILTLCCGAVAQVLVKHEKPVSV